MSSVAVMQNRVLLLNGSTWEPLSVITVPRAINLLLAGKAVVIEESASIVRSMKDRITVPSVIALRTYINVPRRRAHWSRRGVLVRDDYTCIYCGIKPGELQRGKLLAKADFTIDHILPRSRGGRDTWSNTACACSVCNHRKGDRLPHEVGMKLHWEPKTPRTSYLVIALGTGPAVWKRYVEV